MVAINRHPKRINYDLLSWVLLNKWQVQINILRSHHLSFVSRLPACHTPHLCSYFIARILCIMQCNLLLDVKTKSAELDQRTFWRRRLFKVWFCLLLLLQQKSSPALLVGCSAAPPPDRFVCRMWDRVYADTAVDGVEILLIRVKDVI